MEARKFQAGDVVRHGPTGEKWVLACDEVGGRVSAQGWPDSIAQACDCTLIEAVTAEERLSVLRRCAKLAGPPDYSWRFNYAAEQLRIELESQRDQGGAAA